MGRSIGLLGPHPQTVVFFFLSHAHCRTLAVFAPLAFRRRSGFTPWMCAPAPFCTSHPDQESDTSFSREMTQIGPLIRTILQQRGKSAMLTACRSSWPAFFSPRASTYQRLAARSSGEPQARTDQLLTRKPPPATTPPGASPAPLLERREWPRRAHRGCNSQEALMESSAWREKQQPRSLARPMKH